MVGTKRDAANFVAISELSYESALSKFAAVEREENEIRLQLVALKDRAFEQVSPDSAFFGEAELRWQLWREKRVSLLQSELAMKLAQKADAKHHLAKAFRKREGATLMQKKLALIEAKKMQTRQSYES